MAGMSVEYINPFLMAATKIFKDVCQIDLVPNKPYIKDPNLQESGVLINIGITGDVYGHVLLCCSNQVGCDVASHMMMGMPVAEIDDMAKSALCELGNMILGNASTILSTTGIGVDITPPTITIGEFEISGFITQNICVPLKFGDEIVELCISVK